ncbi:GIY-YIG nuclease family protein [Streptomyces sp. ID05-26A]|nr:GIY-YIG nuclease family protein [Streptomyces sp. ID05-26A]
MINLGKGGDAVPGEATSSRSGLFHGDFRLSITKALADQLAAALKRLDHAPLTARNLLAIDERPGVYQLYLNDEFVYVGKADASLRARLSDHFRKLGGRQNISLADVGFSCLYVDEDFSALAPERLLINYYKGEGGIPWNNNGFGNKDPGRKRDTTEIKRNHFDLKFPIDLSQPLSGLNNRSLTLSSFLKVLKSKLPYNFRYAEPPGAASIGLSMPDGEMSAVQAFRLASERLPADWQIVALMGYVIMYGDSPTEYKSAWRYFRHGSVVEAQPEVSAEEMIEDENDLFSVDE